MEKFEEFKKKYISYARDTAIRKETEELTADLKYIQEHFERTKKTKYRIFPTPYDLHIHDFFLKHLFSQFHNIDEKTIYNSFIILEISKILMERAKESSHNLPDLEEWNFYLIDFFDIDLRQHIGSFFGSSHQCEEMRKIFK